MSDKTRERLFGFWSVLDELLNLLLFGLIGLEMLATAAVASRLAAARLPSCWQRALHRRTDTRHAAAA